MQEKHSSISQVLMRVGLVVLGIAIVSGIAIGVIYLLKNFTPKASNSLTPNHIAPVPPAEVIGAYRQPAIDTLADSAYRTQENTGNSTNVIYKAGNYAYTTAIPTKDHTLFVARSTDQADDSKTIEQKTTAFMQTKGYDKINNNGSATSESPLYTTYASNDAVCQLTTAQANKPTNSPASAALACVSKPDIEKEYMAIEKLLAIYRQSHQQPSFTQAIRILTSEGNKAMAIISLSGNDARQALLFAAINEDWKYIGDLNSAAITNGKYSVTPEIQNAFNDPGYGSFLKKNIQ